MKSADYKDSGLATGTQVASNLSDSTIILKDNKYAKLSLDQAQNSG